MMMHLLLLLIVLWFAGDVAGAGRVFMGRHRYSDEEWAAKTDIIDCFANGGQWNLSAYAKDPVRGLHCRTTYAMRQCNIQSRGNVYDYYTGDRCGAPKTYFSVERMCEVMDGRDIAIVGDSLSGEFAVSLMNSIHALLGDVCWTCGAMCYGFYNIDCQAVSERHNSRHIDTSLHVHWKNFTIFESRNDWLSTDSDAKGFVNMPWLSLVHNRDVGLFVLNRGAHFAPDDEFMWSLRTTLAAVERFHPNSTVIWRTTAIGHIDADQQFEARPRTEMPTLEDLTTGVDSEILGFHWQDFRRQNKLVQKMIQTHYPSMIYMDVYRFSAMRHDHHRDRLHYCVPGPISAWVELFYQIVDLFAPVKANIHKVEYKVVPFD
jgi:hypothetical protein